MLLSCTRLFWTLGLVPLALSAAISNEAAKNASAQNVAPYRVTPYCNLVARIRRGDTCFDIIDRTDDTITLTQFLCWNPDVNPSCTNLIPGRDVCVGVVYPGPVC
ncbi:uncharacterized protein N7459_005957 [Penicillium hispanicum]|uniref:uncharacterized protein n=1 Tax=Penicillium hispanicum TaxID=1080232 RepID=UPI00253F65F1|nr:uncharacterized protein N7459_005957 [Penicillium hispanicum]KAJ5579972.1 hypothetical protein N7459_005957 [Penicillium hispanicum]